MAGRRRLHSMYARPFVSRMSHAFHSSISGPGHESGGGNGGSVDGGLGGIGVLLGARESRG
jgi:hypothetical protein